MQMVKLKNGATEMDMMVRITMVTLTSMFQDVRGAIAVFELREKCRNRDHEFFGDNQAYLAKAALVEPDGRVNNTIRNIVLSAVEGEMLEMYLVNPIADPPQPD